MKNIDWSKAPEGFPIWIEDLDPNNGGDLSGWHMELEDRYEDANGDYWSKPEEGYYIAHRRPSSASWTGDGLPTIGITCEYGSGSQKWQRCLILAHINGRVAFSCPDDEDSERVYVEKTPGQWNFRLIVTAEQIVAEEREKAIDQMMELGIGMLSRSEFCGSLFDAGYRKGESK